MVTIDAAGCQRAIVQALRKAGTDYVLAVKRNFHKAVKAASTMPNRAPSRRPADTTALPGLVRGHWGGGGNGLYRTLDVQFREDDRRMRTGNAPDVMGILHRAALNMLRTIQRKLETDLSIGLLRDRIGRQPWLLASALP